MRVNQVLSLDNNESQEEREEVLAAKGNFAERMGDKLAKTGMRAVDTAQRILMPGYKPAEGDRNAIRSECQCRF